MLSDEHGIGGNDAQLDRINVFYHTAFGGKYLPRAVLFDLEHGVIGAVRASPISNLFRPGNLLSQTRRLNGAKTTTEGLTPFLLTPPPLQ